MVLARSAGRLIGRGSCRQPAEHQVKKKQENTDLQLKTSILTVEHSRKLLKRDADKQ